MEKTQVGICVFMSIYNSQATGHFGLSFNDDGGSNGTDKGGGYACCCNNEGDRCCKTVVFSSAIIVVMVITSPVMLCNLKPVALMVVGERKL